MIRFYRNEMHGILNMSGIIYCFREIIGSYDWLGFKIDRKFASLAPFTFHNDIAACRIYYFFCKMQANAVSFNIMVKPAVHRKNSVKVFFTNAHSVILNCQYHIIPFSCRMDIYYRWFITFKFNSV